MFNLDSLTEKDKNNGWPYRKLIIGHQEVEKLIIY